MWSDLEEDETDQATAGFMWRDLGGTILAQSQGRVWLHEVEGSLSLSLSLSRLSLKMVWSENRNVKQFLGQSLYFTVRWNAFPENSIFHAQPNTRWSVKWFPKMVWS